MVARKRRRGREMAYDYRSPQTVSGSGRTSEALRAPQIRYGPQQRPSAPAAQRGYNSYQPQQQPQNNYQPQQLPPAAAPQRDYSRGNFRQPVRENYGAMPEYQGAGYQGAQNQGLNWWEQMQRRQYANRSSINWQGGYTR